MAVTTNLMTALRDLFPFGKDYEVTPPTEAPRAQNSPTKKDNQEDVLSDESFQRYKRREVAVNTQTNFLTTLGGYLNRITMALGGLAALAAAPFIPYVGAVITSLSPAAVAASTAAFWPLAIAAVVSGVATLAVGQYTTRLNTEKNTNNTDWYQKRNTAMIGQEVAKALAEQKSKTTSRADGKSWAESVPQKQPQTSWQEAVVSAAPEAAAPTPRLH